MLKFQIRLIFSMMLISLIVISGCKKSPEIPMNNYVHFPIGQRSISDSSFIVEADSVIHDFTIFHDEYGGRWVRIAFNKLNKNSVVKISFLKKAGPLVSLPQSGPVPEMWLKPSTYIDCNHTSIIKQAEHLTDGIEEVSVKARNIQLFVWDYLDFKVFRDCGLVTASATLKDHYGTCINFARLFVAICRASGIPARSVWGSLNTGGSSYRSHHNWAEFLGDDGNWHAVGLSFTNTFDLNDLRYLDLLYGPEENHHIEEFKMFTISNGGDYFYYDGSGSAVDGKLNVETLTNNFPEEMELSMGYSISDLFEK